MFPSLRYTRLDPGCSLRAIHMTNGCIIPGNKPLVKQFFPKNCENPKNRRKKEPPGGRFFFVSVRLSMAAAGKGVWSITTGVGWV